MASLVNAIKHLRKNEYQFLKMSPRKFKRKPFSFHFRRSASLDTPDRRNYNKKTGVSAVA